jgi:sulfur carrier protein
VNEAEPIESRLPKKETAALQIKLNGEPRTIDANLTLAELLEQLQVKRQHVAVEVNAELVPREEHSRRLLAEGDTLEIVTLVGGG